MSNDEVNLSISVVRAPHYIIVPEGTCYAIFDEVSSNFERISMEL